MWNLEPPPGFQGLRDDIPLQCYDRHLPHWRQSGATYFVTFRLADSLPASRLRELRGLRDDWERRYPPPRSWVKLEELARMQFERIEQWLDQGAGSCLLGDPRRSRAVVNAMLHFHDDRYELGTLVVMPNHVHAIVRPLDHEIHPLDAIVRSWKAHTARGINCELGQRGTLWQEESYDRIIRDPQHLWRTIQYIARNPAKANRSRDLFCFWHNPSWQSKGWRIEDE